MSFFSEKSSKGFFLQKEAKTFEETPDHGYSHRANPICWANEDMPELGGDPTFETILSEAKQVGFEGMEPGDKFPRTPEALKAALAPYGRASISGEASDPQRRCRIRRQAEISRQAEGHGQHGDGSVRAFQHEGEIDTPLSRRPHLQGDAWKTFGARMTALGDRMMREGMRIVYHHHMGRVVQSEDDIHAFMAHTGPLVDLQLDTSHAVLGGADPAQLAARYRDRISHLHTKDIRAAARAQSETQDWSFLKSVLNGAYSRVMA